MFKPLNIVCICLLLVFFSCKVDPKIEEPLVAKRLEEVIPKGWPQPVYTFSKNVLSDSTFVLGRALFYDFFLIKDNTISCGSCHQNFVAFAHAEHRVSHGINELEGTRNTPAIFNVTWHPYFMHDGGINHIEVQPLGPITNPIEMAENIGNVVTKLQSTNKYKQLFKGAFGTDSVTTQRMFRAMAQFMGMMYSYNSKYDYYKRGENQVQFNDAELRGYNLFIAKCNACHKEPLFSDFQFRNNGLAVNSVYNDVGRAHITRLATDTFKFKTPSLRNVTKTGPYMHDGRYTTLEQCLDHYTNGVKNFVNLDPLLSPNGLQLSAQEKQDIIAFLNTLTDFQFINDKRFANPNL